MSDPVTLAELVQYAEDQSGTNTRTTRTKGVRAVNRALRWAWRRMADGYEGFAIRETEFLSPASGFQLNIQAGEGGANGTTPIVRGVLQVRDIHRPAGPNDASGPLYPAEFLPLTTYRDRFGVPSLTDEQDKISRPGIYAYRQAEDATVDELRVRPRWRGPERVLMTYTPVALVMVDDTDTLESLDNADEVIATRAAYHLALAQDRQLAEARRQAADMLMVEYVEGYKGKRDVNGSDPVDRYRRRQHRRSHIFGGGGW